jgi:hypothetical protein
MLALKKKREAEQKAAAAAAAAENDTTTATGERNQSGTTGENGESSSTTSGSNGTTKISLLGIGGMKKKENNATSNNSASKKRTPGEIRIQKGTYGNSDPCFVIRGRCQTRLTLQASILSLLILMTLLKIFYRYSRIGWGKSGQNYLPQDQRLQYVSCTNYTGFGILEECDLSVCIYHTGTLSALPTKG